MPRPSPVLAPVPTSLAGAALVAVALAPLAAAQTLKLEPVVQGPPETTGIHHAGDGSGRLFLLSKAGTIEVFDGTAMLPTPFLDITSQVTSAGVERGLHGLAFHPDYASNGLFYLVYTDLGSDTVLSRWSVSAGDPDVADPTSEQVLLFLDQPDQYHNVSQLAFGPDGYLYVGAGDGGFIGDPDDRAQDLGDLLGKLLRLDVDAAFPYGIPPDNPFVGVPGARPEIWAYGVRNPWRFSFDRATGDLYMGDVGQWSWEEVNLQPGDSPGGENYGWRLKEGTACFDPPSGCDAPGLTAPILEYGHGIFGGDCAVVGGFVYRGALYTGFDGAYFYGDFCSGKIWRATRDGDAWTSEVAIDTALAIHTFGEDEAGELYLGDAEGVIRRLVDPIPFCDLELDQPAYVLGDPVVATTARLANHGDASQAVRVQLAGQVPGFPPVVLLDVGAGGTLVLPPGFDADFAPLPIATLVPGLPLGTYGLSCRLTDPATGAVLSESVLPFPVG